MVSEAAPQLRHLLRPILHWLDDPATEEIAINKPGEVFIRQKGVFARYDLASTMTTLKIFRSSPARCADRM
jgi:type IV secretion system protein VirB11